MISGDVLGERARLSPDKTALVEVATGRRFTYAELDARAKAAARALTEGLGLKKGDRLALLADNRVEFLDVFFACGKSGRRPRAAQHAADGGGAGEAWFRTRSRKL